MQYLKAQFKIIVLYYNSHEQYSNNGNIWEPRISIEIESFQNATLFQWIFDKRLTILRKIKEIL